MVKYILAFSHSIHIKSAKQAAPPTWLNDVDGQPEWRSVIAVTLRGKVE